MPTTMQQPIAGPSKPPARLRTRSKSRTSRPLLSKQGSLVQLPADKQSPQPNKTLYTPVFYPTANDTNNGKGKAKAKDSSGLSQATLKRLDQLSKMHVALSSGAIPDIPASSQGSPPPPRPSDNNGTQDVREILQELPNLPPEVANNPRVMGIRKAILDALEDCNYDPSHGKWARVSDLVRLGVTSGREGRWAGANGVDSGERVVLPAGDEGKGTRGKDREEVILPPNHDLTHLLNINPTTGTNSRGLGWCNASTEEQWMIWEDKFEDEIKLRVKIEKWQRSVVQGSQDAPLPLDEFEHDLPEVDDDEEEVDVEGGGGEEGDTGLQSPPPTARGRVRVTTSGPQHLTTTRSSRPDPLKSTSALGSLGFTMSKRSAIAGSSSKPPPPRQPKRIQQPQPRNQAVSRQNTANNGDIVQDLRVSLADLETSRVSRRRYAGSVAGSAISRTSSRKRELLTRKKAFEGYVSGYSSSRAGSEAGDRDGRESRAGSPGAKGKGRQQEVEGQEGKGEKEKRAKEKAQKEKEKEDERQARKKRYANPTTQERRAAANGQMNLGDTSEEFLQSTGFQLPSLEPSFRFSQLITSTPLPLHPLPVPRSGSRKPGPTAEVLLARQAEAEAQRRRAVGPSRILNFHRDSQSQSSSSLPPGLGSSKPTSLAALKDVSMESIPGLGGGSSLQHHRAPESPTPRSRKPKRKVDEMNGVSGHAANSSFGHAAPGGSGEGNGESQLKKPRTDSGGWTTGRTSGSFMPYISPQGNNSNSMLEQAQLDSLYLQQQPSAQANDNNGDGQDVLPNQISQDSIYNPSTTPSKQRRYGPPVPGLPSSTIHANDADAAPVTPTRDHFEPPPQTSRFVDLLESAKQAKQERIARRRSAKAAKFGAGLKEAVIPAPVGEIRDVDAAAAVANGAVVSQEEVVEDLRPPIPGMAEVPPPPATPTAVMLEPVNAVVLQQTTVVAAVPTRTALAPAAIALIADVFGVPQQPGSTPPFSSSPAAGEDPQVTPPPAEQNGDEEEPVAPVAAETSWPSQIPGLGSGSGSAAGGQEGKGAAPVQQGLEPPSTPLAPRIRAVQGGGGDGELLQGSPMRIVSPAPARRLSPTGAVKLVHALEKDQQLDYDPAADADDEDNGEADADADGESDHVDILIPLRDHESDTSSVHSLGGKISLNPLDVSANLNEIDIYTHDDDDEDGTRSVYAIEYASSDVDLKSPLKSLSSLAGSDSDSEEQDELEEEQGYVNGSGLGFPGQQQPQTFDLPPPDTSIEFDPQFVSTQVNGPNINGDKSMKTPTKKFPAASQPVTPATKLLSHAYGTTSSSQPSPNKFPASSQYGYGFSQPFSEASGLGGGKATGKSRGARGYSSQFDVDARIAELDRFMEGDLDWLKDLSEPEVDVGGAGAAAVDVDGDED